MAFPTIHDSRRVRRRRNLAIVLIAVVAVGIVALAVRYRTEAREASDFLAAAEVAANGQNVVAAQLEDLFTSIGDIERPDILERIASLATDAEAIRTELAAATVSRPVGKVSGFLTAATEAWWTGLDTMDEAIIRVLDDPDDSVAGDLMLADSFLWLRVGDAAYIGFLNSLGELEPELQTIEYPPVAYVGPDRAALFDATAVAARLRLIRKLGQDHDIGITATTNPEPFGLQAGVPVVPFSETFSVMVVVTNVGNLSEEAIAVRLTLESSSAPSEPIEAQQLIPRLEPGQARTVEFADLDVKPGQLYNLRIVATIAEDSDLTNNEFELLFTRNTSE